MNIRRYWITLEDIPGLFTDFYGYCDVDLDYEQPPQVGDWVVVTRIEDGGNTLRDQFGQVKEIHYFEDL